MKFVWPASILEPVRRDWTPRLLHLHLVLAVTVVIVLGISMLLTQHMGDAFQESLAVNRPWDRRLDRYQDLFAFIARAQDAGVQATRPVDVPLALRRLHQAIDSLDATLQELEADILGNAGTLAARDLRLGLGEVRRDVAAAAAVTDGLLRRVAGGTAPNDDERTAALTAAYDEAFGVTARALQSAQQARNRVLQRQIASAGTLRRGEYLVSALALILLMGITDYGYRLDRHTRQRQRELELLAQQLHQANDGLERRVAQRTAELEQTHEALRQAQKLEVIARLAGAVAHDFNNVLTAILGYSQFLLDALPPDDQRRQDVEEIQRAGERASALTQQLLASSRKQILQFEVVDLNRVVTGLDQMLRRIIGEDIKLLIRADPALGPISSDVAQIEQVITNLAVNARDAMPTGGKLVLQTENLELDEMYAQDHQPVLAGSYVMLAVSDTGSGMTDEVKSHLFERSGHALHLWLHRRHGRPSRRAGGGLPFLQKPFPPAALVRKVRDVLDHPPAGRPPRMPITGARGT